jgi:putative membrane protein
MSEGLVIETGLYTVASYLGMALGAIALLMVASGISYHLAFMHGLRNERVRLVAAGLVHGESKFPVSMTLVVAVLLLLTGMFAIAKSILPVQCPSMRSESGGFR